MASCRSIPPRRALLVPTQNRKPRRKVSTQWEILNAAHWIHLIDCNPGHVLSQESPLSKPQDMTCIGSKQLKSKLQSLIEYWPAPTIPIAKMELCDTSASLSCDNLLRVSTILSWGLDADRMARAKGTARRITGSPYCSWNERIGLILKLQP